MNTNKHYIVRDYFVNLFRETLVSWYVLHTRASTSQNYICNELMFIEQLYDICKIL